MSNQNGRSSDKEPISPTVSGTTANDSEYDVEAAGVRTPSKNSIARLCFWRSNGSTNLSTKSPVQTITRKLEDSPKGYPMVANFTSSDRNFLQFRCFLELHSRVLLDIQYDIELLEKELDELDNWDRACKDTKRQNCLKCIDRDRMTDSDEMPEEWKEHPDFEFTRTRPVVLAELRQKLMEYDEVLLKTKEVNALQRPSSRDYHSIVNWFDSRKPLVDEEAEYIKRREDIVTLRTGREGAGFDGLVERTLAGLDGFLQKRCRCNVIQNIFMTPELRIKTSDKYVHYYSPERIDLLVNLIITVIIFVLLVIPIIIFYEVSKATRTPSPFEAVGILIIFTLLFGGAMSSLTKATRQELFAASAAYCAVLVVFIGNFIPQDAVLVRA